MEMSIEAIKIKNHEASISWVPVAEQEAFEDFLLEKWQHSPNSWSLSMMFLKWFYDRAGKPTIETSRLEAREYFKSLNEREGFKRVKDPVSKEVTTVSRGNIAQSTKNNAASVIRSFADKVIEYYVDRGFEYTNPFPRKFDFTRSSAPRKAMPFVSMVIPEVVIDDILKRAREESMRDYLLFLIMKHCGTRISECVSIRNTPENINLDERMFVTGLEHGHRKTNKKDGDYYLYFFDEKVEMVLRQYLRLLKPGSEWLFPATKKPGSFFTTVSAEHLFTRYGLSKTHSFRHTIITKRLNMGCPLPVSHILVNQECGDVQLKYYYKYEPGKIRELYDKWNPWK